jgi:hypothetical protein
VQQLIPGYAHDTAAALMARCSACARPAAST